MSARYRISILSDRDTWMNDHIEELIRVWKRDGHRVAWVHTPGAVPPGDMLFLLSCGQIVGPTILRRNAHNLVVHASALPKGKGWSPLTWQILEGRSSIPVTLFEAAERVDSGVIYLQDRMKLGGHELIEECRDVLAQKTIALCRRFVKNFSSLRKRGKAQRGKSSFYGRRTAKDSRLDPRRTLAEQFDLLRTVDNNRYPAFFDHRGHRYVLSIRKATREEEKR